jgi:hypothetical protein
VASIVFPLKTIADPRKLTEQRGELDPEILTRKKIWTQEIDILVRLNGLCGSWNAIDFMFSTLIKVAGKLSDFFC